jgi:hypothetical protein
MQKGQSKMGNTKKLATFGTQYKEKTQHCRTQPRANKHKQHKLDMSSPTT